MTWRTNSPSRLILHLSMKYATKSKKNLIETKVYRFLKIVGLSFGQWGDVKSALLSHILMWTHMATGRHPETFASTLPIFYSLFDIFFMPAIVNAENKNACAQNFRFRFPFLSKWTGSSAHLYYYSYVPMYVYPFPFHTILFSCQICVTFWESSCQCEERQSLRKEGKGNETCKLFTVGISEQSPTRQSP